MIGALHDRMPVILPEKHWAKWLGEEPAKPAELKAMLVPIDDDALKLWPVNRQKIGNVRNKEAEVAQPQAVRKEPTRCRRGPPLISTVLDGDH